MMDRQSPIAAMLAGDAFGSTCDMPRWTRLRLLRAITREPTNEAPLRVVGVRDHESGHIHLFRVYALYDPPQPEPPDFDPPPAAPARSRPYARLHTADDISQTRAA